MGDKTKIGFAARSARQLGMTLEAYLAEVSAGRKWCIRHREWHSVAEFGSDRSQKDGLNQSCRASFRVAVKRYRPSFGMRGKRMSIETRLKMSASHKGKTKRPVSAYHKWCRTCQEELRIERFGPDRSRGDGLNVDCRKCAPIRKHWLPRVFRECLTEEFEGICAYCQNAATTWDHVIPVSKDGKSAPDNILPSCGGCNSSKQDRDLEEWLVATGRTISLQAIERLAHYQVL